MKKFHKKSLALLVSVAVLLTFAVSGTVAYLVDASGPVENQFKPASVTPDIREDTTSEPGVKKDVKIANTGTTSAYIRALIVVTWQKTENGVTYTLPAVSGDYTLTTSLYATTNWVQYGGYYYHTTPVEAGGTTDVLITSAMPVSDKAPDGYSLHVEILAQAIQDEPINAVGEAWGVSITKGNVTSYSSATN